MGNKLLFIEILDNEVLCLLNCLKLIFNKKKSKTGIHITIKGPQKSFRNKSINKFLEEKMPIEIYSAGMFNNENCHIVYLKVKGENIKGHMWSKPDYPDEYNPHITLYKGENENLANSIYSFILNEDISLSTSEYITRIHTLKQGLLFPSENLYSENGFPTLIKNGSINSDILERAKSIISNTPPLTSK